MLPTREPARASESRASGRRAVARLLGIDVATAVRRVLPERIAAVIEEEAAAMTGYARRLGPTRRRIGILGLALLALIALGGVAGAAEPDPRDRSALEAWAASPAPSLPLASAAVVAAPVAPVASVAVASAMTAPANAAVPAPANALPTTALANSSVFAGPDPLDLVAKGALVVALLFVTLRVLRRVQGGAATKGLGLLDVMETRALGPKVQLHLVAIGDRRLVIGQTPTGLVALGELDAAELPLVIPEAPELERSDRMVAVAMREPIDETPAPRSRTAPDGRLTVSPAPSQSRLAPRVPGLDAAPVTAADRMARVDRALAAADRAADAADRAAEAAVRAAGVADRASLPGARPASSLRALALRERDGEREPAARILERALERDAVGSAARTPDRTPARTPDRTPARLPGRATDRVAASPADRSPEGIAARLAQRLAGIDDAGRLSRAAAPAPGPTLVRDEAGSAPSGSRNPQPVQSQSVPRRRLEVSA